MKRLKVKRKAYSGLETKVVAVVNESALLAGSPQVQPGGGGGGSVTVVPLDPDDEDTEITGAKKFSAWDMWED